MPQDDIRKEALEVRSSSDAGSGSVSPQNYDPSTEPTVFSARLDPVPTQPTRIDPDAPIHHGAVAMSGRPSGRNHVALPAGYVLHEFTIEAVLGTGSFGITYLARDNNLQCQVAIKEYLPNDLAVRTGGQTVCARTESDTHGYRIGLDGFLAESRVLAGFRHPGIVRVTRFFEANNTAYMVMDYEEGEPLRDWIKQHGPIDELQLLSMFLPLLDGLDVVHKAPGRTCMPWVACFTGWSQARSRWRPRRGSGRFHALGRLLIEGTLQRTDTACHRLGADAG